MNSEDLMIGNWVNFNGTIDKVQEIFYLSGRGYCASFAASATLFPILMDKITPIPLTREILEKNSFEYYPIGHGDYGWCLFTKDKYGEKLLPFTLILVYGKDNEFIWGPEIDDNESYYIHVMGRIKYVHELQNLINLCKLDIKIEL